MPEFAAAARQADDTRLPVVEGVAVQLEPGADARSIGPVVVKLQAHLGGKWESLPRGGGWFDVTPEGGATPPELDRTWDALREIRQIRGVRVAEPLLLFRLPSEGDAADSEKLGVWAKGYDAATEAKIKAESAAHDWSLRQMRVPEAWAAWRVKHPGDATLLPGAGIRVAHPDTGYTKHPQIETILDGKGRNFVERETPDDARDPLTATGKLDSPGHGTGTASVIASGSGEVSPDKDVIGVAPGARIRPLRVSTSVIHLSFRNVTLAIEDAITSGSHVVSMSLGGPYSSQALRDVVARALDAGIIVVSAAGNYFPVVFFPAAIPGVIACAASNAATIPWHYSGFGEEVVITAPGELVWRAKAGRDGGNDVFGQSPGTGTSHATASMAGVAALWLSFHGRDSLVARYPGSLLAFAFHLLLRQTANATPDFVREGKGGFGAGIVDAERLLKADLPAVGVVAELRDTIMRRDPGNLIDLSWRELIMLLRVPTHAPFGPGELAAAEPAPPDESSVRSLVAGLLGGEPNDPQILRELTALIASGPALHGATLGAVWSVDASRQASVGKPNQRALIALRRRLLRAPLSATLRDRLTAAQEEGKRLLPRRAPAADVERRFEPTPPAVRRLRAFAFDPSLATRVDTAVVNAVTISVPYEAKLRKGPVGDYLEVVDIDPATYCAYPPVDLNDPSLMAQDGLPQSEGNPQFHQQMVYAVAMKTIRHFEDAFGRPIFWSPLRPWSGRDDVASDGADGDADRGDQPVYRLRMYPHALREANAYYNPAKRAILFGYFPARTDDPGEEYPGGVVFTCLSHDIIAHETTHAILDGMHVYFTEPTNPDVFAFHEAFADIVALLQHFTYPEVLRDQIARTRGDLTSENLLGQLARQFGVATGGRHSLRDAIGGVAIPAADAGGASELIDRARRAQAPRVTPAGRAGATAPEPPPAPRWMRYQRDPFLLSAVEEAHARGAILVAAVFDAFLAIYSRRTADLMRIATGGTGVLPAGRLLPDLVNRMADEASKAAEHVLTMCIRAMDYVPPVDITFGEFLRALITADHDLVPDDERLYRIAFIEAFRGWGIYPRDVRTLSEESLLWHTPGDLNLFPDPVARSDGTSERRSSYVALTQQLLRQAALDWRPGGDRSKIFERLQEAQRLLHGYLRGASTMHPGPEWLARIAPGIDLREPFAVANLRPARRVGPDGEFTTEIVFELVQPAADPPDATGAGHPFRGGVTVVVGLDDWQVRYTIYKRRVDAGGALNLDRQERQLTFERRMEASLGSPLGAAEYRCVDAATVTGDRGVDREAMRASSCACRAGKARPGGAALAGPFALLHRGRE